MTSDSYYTYLIYYIHRNPQKHGFTRDFRDYLQTSYRALLSNESTFLAKAEVMDWFGGIENFIRAHEKVASEFIPNELFGEE